MCAIMVFEVKPLNVTWTLSVLAAGSSVIVADPVAGELLDGISFAPKRLVTKVVGFAWAAAAGSIRAANSINAVSRRMNSSPVLIDQTLVDADIVATNRVARKPPKPDVNRL